MRTRLWWTAASGHVQGLKTSQKWWPKTDEERKNKWPAVLYNRPNRLPKTWYFITTTGYTPPWGLRLLFWIAFTVLYHLTGDIEKKERGSFVVNRSSRIQWKTCRSEGGLYPSLSFSDLPFKIFDRKLDIFSAPSATVLSCDATKASQCCHRVEWRVKRDYIFVLLSWRGLIRHSTTARPPICSSTPGLTHIEGKRIRR